MTRDEYVELLKSTALDIGTKMVMPILVAKLPFLALPIINPIAGFVVGFILNIAIKQTEMGSFFLFIDLRVNKEGQAFEAAALKHSQEPSAQSEKDLIDAFRAFVKFSN